MYEVNDAVLTALNAQSYEHHIEGQITLTTGAVFQIAESEIVPASLTINNKAVNSSDFCLGSVYVGECSVTIKKNLDRYSVYNAKVEFWDVIAETRIPLGVYYVDTPTRTKKLLSLKCYDIMTKFDDVVTAQIIGTPMELLTAICKKCEIPLVNTNLNEFVNTDYLMSIEPEHTKTYREAISYITSMLCGFATITRDEKLIIKKFQTKPTGSVSASKRTSSTISDYQTYFAGVTATFLAEQNFVEYKKVSKDATGLILNLGAIPIIKLTPEAKYQILQNILDELLKIKYVPSDFKIVGNPLIELGDCLTLEDVNGTDDSVQTLVTSFTWNYHKETSLKSSGADARLSGIQTSTDRAVANALTSAESKSIIIHSATNAKAITVHGAETEIIRISFITASACEPMFFATIPFTLDCDGDVIFTYYLNQIPIESDTLTKYLCKGTHFLTLYNHFLTEASEMCTIVVKMQTAFTGSDSRTQNSNIVSIMDYINNSRTSLPAPVLDNTVPTASIEELSIKSSIFAQGLSTSEAEEWDGTLEFTDEFDRIPLYNFTQITVKNFNTAVSITEQIPVGGTFEASFDRIPLYNFTQITVKGIMEHLDVNKVVTGWTMPDEENQPDYSDVYIIHNNDEYSLKSEYEFNSEPAVIEEGSLSVCSVNIENLSRVDGIEVMEV